MQPALALLSKSRPSWLDGFINSESYWKSASNWPRRTDPTDDIPSWANLFWLPAFVNQSFEPVKTCLLYGQVGLELGFGFSYLEEHHNFMWVSSIGKQPFYSVKRPDLPLPNCNHGSVGQWIGISAIILQLVGWEPQETASSKHQGRFFETRIFNGMDRIGPFPAISSQTVSCHQWWPTTADSKDPVAKEACQNGQRVARRKPWHVLWACDRNESRTCLD